MADFNHHQDFGRREDSSFEAHDKPSWDMQSFEWDSFMLSAEPTVGATSIQPLQMETGVGLGNAHDFASNVSSITSSAFNAGVHLAQDTGMGSHETQRSSHLVPGVSSFGMSGTTFLNPDCPNLRAGRIPCACTDEDEMLVRRLQGRRPDLFSGFMLPTCQVAGCPANLLALKEYHQRHRVCEEHAKAASLLHQGEIQRYCQQCGRFHVVEDFDEGKRSCRRKLERHNTRRRRKKMELKDGGKETASGSGNEMSPTSSGPETKLQTEGRTMEGKKEAAGDKESGKKKGRKKAAKEDVEKASKQKRMKKGSKLADAQEGKTQESALPASSEAAVSNPFHQSESAATRGSSPSAPENLSESTPVDSVQSDAEARVVDKPTVADKLPAASETAEAVDNSGASPCLTPGTTSHGIGGDELSLGEAQFSAQPWRQQSPVTAAPLQTPAPPRPGAPLGFQISMPYPRAQPLLSAETLSSKTRVLPPLKALLPTESLSGSSLAAEAGTRPAVSAGLDGVPVSPSMPPLPANPPQCDEQTLMALLFEERSGQEQAQVQQAPASSTPLAPALQQHPLQQHSSMTPPPWGLSHQPPPSYTPPNPTSRMSFKLYDWNPGDFPRRLRNQIMEWLAQMPSDLEGYIRPGCTVLTLRTAMPPGAWAELDGDLRGSLLRLMGSEAGSFFGRGRMLVQAQRQLAYVDTGKIRSVTRLRPLDAPQLLQVRPLCVVAGQPAPLRLTGRGLRLPGARVLCSMGGAYLLQQPIASQLEETREEEEDEREGVWEEEEERCAAGGGEEELDRGYGEVDPALLRLESLSLVFPSVPGQAAGTASIEVDHGAACSNALSVLVADSAVCSEVSQLERLMEDSSELEVLEARGGQGVHPREDWRRASEAAGSLGSAAKGTERQVAGLLDDLGWVLASLGKSEEQLSHTWASSGSEGLAGVPVRRLRGLLGVAVHQGWEAVTGRLLQAADKLDQWGAACCPKWWSRGAVVCAVGIDEDGFGLLHGAVARGHLGLVEELLEYGKTQAGGPEVAGQWWHASWPGHGGVTPLHLAALRADADGLVQLLTGVGSQALAWTQARDASGRTPHEYALCAGHLQYDEVVGKQLLTCAGLGSSSVGALGMARPLASSGAGCCMPSSPLDKAGLNSETRIAMPPLRKEGLLEGEEAPLLASWGEEKGKQVTTRGTDETGHSLVGNGKSATWRKGLVDAMEGLKSCHVAVRTERRVGPKVMATLFVVLVACAGICVLLVHPHQMNALSMSLRRCLKAMANRFRMT